MEIFNAFVIFFSVILNGMCEVIVDENYGINFLCLELRNWGLQKSRTFVALIESVYLWANTASSLFQESKVLGFIAYLLSLSWMSLPTQWNIFSLVLKLQRASNLSGLILSNLIFISLILNGILCAKLDGFNIKYSNFGKFRLYSIDFFFRFVSFWISNWIAMDKQIRSDGTKWLAW